MAQQENLKRPVVLAGKQVFLTPAILSDSEEMVRWTNDLENQFLGSQVPFPRYPDRQREALEERIKNKGIHDYAIIGSDTGDHVGDVVIYNIDEMSRSCEWGLIIAPEARGRKIATEVGRLVFDFVFRELGMNRLHSSTNAKNHASIKLQENLGMKREGTMRQAMYLRGEYLDFYHYGILREEYVKVKDEQ